MHEAAHAAFRGGAGQCGGGRRLVEKVAIGHPAMRPIREVNDNLDAGEMPRPIGLRTDIANRLHRDTGNRLSRPARDTADHVTGPNERVAQRAANKAGGAGYEDSRQPALRPAPSGGRPSPAR